MFAGWVRKQVDFANVMLQNRYGLPAAGTYKCAVRGIPAGDAINIKAITGWILYLSCCRRAISADAELKGNTMKNKAIKIGIIASILPHLFCCVLPIVLAVLSLFAPEVAHSEHFLPKWIEPWLFVFSALMLGLSWLLVVRDCPCKCDKCDDDNNHKPQKIVLSVVTLLFVVSIVLHIMAHH